MEAPSGSLAVWWMRWIVSTTEDLSSKWFKASHLTWGISVWGWSAKRQKGKKTATCNMDLCSLMDRTCALGTSFDSGALQLPDVWGAIFFTSPQYYPNVALCVQHLAPRAPTLRYHTGTRPTKIAWTACEMEGGRKTTMKRELNVSEKSLSTTLRISKQKKAMIKIKNDQTPANSLCLAQHWGRRSLCSSTVTFQETWQS